jgi:hypothetical protein
MLKSKSKIPKVISYCALKLIKNSLTKKCGYNVLSCAPIDVISNIRTPCLFVIGEKDDMVLYRKFIKMFEKCNANKKKLIVEVGLGHPDARTEECIDQIMDFINVDQLTESEIKQNNLFENLKKDSILDVMEDSTKSEAQEVDQKRNDSKKMEKDSDDEQIMEEKKEHILDNQENEG